MTIGAAKPTQRVSKSVRSAQTIPSTKSAATNITREQFYGCALELSPAIHMQEVMKSNPKKVDPLAVHAFVSFRLSHMPLQPSWAVFWFSQEFVTCLIEHLSQI